MSRNSSAIDTLAASGNIAGGGVELIHDHVGPFLCAELPGFNEDSTSEANNERTGGLEQIEDTDYPALMFTKLSGFNEDSTYEANKERKDGLE